MSTTTPYEFLYQFKDNSFVLNQMLEKMSAMANSLKIRNFKKLFHDYVEAQRKAAGIITADSTTQFEGQELELNCGQWQADEYGITRDGQFGEIEACNHPLLPVMRLVNIDTGVEKLKLAYRKGKQWRHVIAEKKVLASNNAILDLANVGIAVNSDNAKWMVQYLHDVEALNYDEIPEKNSVSRLGWIHGEGFSPYVENLVYDGENNFKGIFDSVKPHGDFEKWKEAALSVRSGSSVPARMILAASFASVLVPIAEALSFFVHLWGSESGTGKTVALMLAASVWADPQAGQYIKTFNGTQVSLELTAGFVNNLPLILDEFQMLRNKKDFEQIVYMLAEGVGKGRGGKTGGVRETQTWKNCILTSGETPITNFMTGAGAFNRIVEIECTEKLFPDPMGLLAVIRQNYGSAGKLFVEKLQEEGAAQRVKELYTRFYKEIVQSDTTEKQAMAGAVILAADRLADEWIFEDGKALQYEEIAEYLHAKSEVDVNERAYDYICETIAANAQKFGGDALESWGRFSGNQVQIIRSIFEKICEEGGYSSRATLSWLMRKKLLEPSFKKDGKPIPTRQVKIGGTNVRCVVMTLQENPDDNWYDDIG